MPSSSRCVANECLNAWLVTRFSIPAAWAARLTASLPPERRAPLLQLPRLPHAALPQHLRTPERRSRLPPGLQFVPQPEVLKPLQQHQKSRTFPVRKPPKSSQILSPTPACLACHGRIHRHPSCRLTPQCQYIKCSFEHSISQVFRCFGVSVFRCFGVSVFR